MATFLDDQREARRVAQLLADYDRRLKALERETQAPYTSIEGGAMDIYDTEGTLKGSVGVQPDGGVALIPVNTTPPPTPTVPTVEPVLAGLLVGWDGQWDDSYTTPSDFSLVQVHVGSAADFAPDVTTQVATITALLGGTVTIAIKGYDPVWVRLVGQNTAAVTGPPSTAVQGTPRQAVPQDLIDGIVTETKLANEAVTKAKVKLGAIGADQLALGVGNLAPDPSFEGPRTVQLLADLPELDRADWTLAPAGRDSATALTVDCTSPAITWKNLELARFPILTGERHFLALDYRVSADFNGTGAKAFLRYEDAAGVVLGYGVASKPLVPGGDWDRATTQILAPPNTAMASLRVEASEVMSGRAWFDNVELRTVVAGGMVVAGSISATELAVNSVNAEHIVALGVTAEKIAALAITADKLAALSVTAAKLAANSVTATKIAAGIIDATHIKAGSLTADRLSLGTDGNVIADPSFEGAVSDQRVAGSSFWSIATPGNGTERALQVSAVNATAVTRSMTLATLPALPGQKVWLSMDYLASNDWAGLRISLYGQWLDNAGNILGYSTLTTGDGLAVKGAWTRLSGVPTAAAPTGTTQLRVACSSTEATAGTVQFDNTMCRVVMASGVSGARAEMSPQGLQLFDDNGEEAVALMTGRPNYVTLSNGGQAVATIDQQGNAGFGDLAVAGNLSVGGDPIGGLIAESARGLVALDLITSSVSAGTTDYGFVELSFNADTSRMYRIVLDCYANPSVLGGELVLVIKDAGTATPTISSTQIQSAIWPMNASGSQRVRMELIRSGTAFGAGQHRLLTTFRVQAGPAGQTVALFGGTNHPAFFYVEDVGPSIADTGQFNAGGGSTAPPVQKYTKTYAASWSGSYANRGAYNSYYGNQMMCGYYSSTNGIQASLVGFPAALGTDLAGATINKAEIYLYFDHWYSNSGGTAVIKAHKHTSRPSTFSSDAESQSVTWARNQGKWVDITSVFDSTTWRGIALDPNSTSSTYYGSARGVGETYPPQLRVTYTK